MANYQASPSPTVLTVITKANWGGAQRYVYDLAVASKSHGYDMAVVFGQGEILGAELEKAGIRTIRIPSLGRDISFLNDLRAFFALIRIFRKERPGIVHLNSSKIGGLGTLAARIARVPKIIFTAHGWPFLEDRSLFKTKLIKLASWLTIFFSTQVIDITRTSQKIASAFPGAQGKISLVYNGIEPAIELKSKKEAQEFLAHTIGKTPDFFRGKVVAGTLSELTKNKGLSYAIRAINKIKDLPFVYIVMGEGEERPGLEKQIRELGLEEKIFLPGFIENASAYLPGLDIFALTSVKEGFPYSILEAGLAELPVMATSVGGIPEIIDDTLNGVLIDPKNAPHIAAALTYLIENKVAREIMGKNLREKVLTTFTKERWLEETFELY